MSHGRRSPRGSKLVMLAALSVAACSDGIQGESNTGPVGFAIADEEVATPPGPSLDELFAAVAAEVPGFAGLYVAADGTPTVQLTDTLRRAAAQVAVVARFGSLPAVRTRPMRFQPAEYGFGELSAWRGALYSAPLPEGVRLVDIDEQQNRLHVGVRETADVPVLRAHLTALGIPGQAAVVDLAPAVQPLATFLASAVRPTMGGLQMAGTYHGCTLGFNAKFAGSGTRYLTTNSHCTLVVGALDGSVFGQPLLSGLVLGTEWSDPAFVQGGGCPAGWGCRYADVILARYDTTSVALNFTIARTLFAYTGSDPTQSGSTELAAEPFFVVGELGDTALVLGASLSKVGATSGWTSGVLVGTCQDWIYDSTNMRMLRCQYEVDAVARSGDSGSPVFAHDLGTGQAWLAGIMWGSGAGTFIFSPVSGVKQDLGALIVSKGVF